MNELHYIIDFYSCSLQKLTENKSKIFLLFFHYKRNRKGIKYTIFMCRYMIGKTFEYAIWL